MKMSEKTSSGKKPKVIEPLQVRQARSKVIIDELRQALPDPDKQVITDAKSLESFSRDKSSFESDLPTAVVSPRCIEEVVSVVRICARHKMPMTPRGAGTGLEGGCIPFSGGIVIDTTGLKKMEFDDENSCVWVGAGVRKWDLVKAARQRGMIFGPDPASNACLGGMVSTSGSGMTTLRYGTTRENVLSLRVVTPSGNAMQTRQVVRKSSSGLELTQLYIGSEGTLGVVCEICFRLFPLTTTSAAAYAGFKCLGDAVKSVVELKKRGYPPTLLRLEIMNEQIVKANNITSNMSLPEMTLALIEFTSNDPTMVDIKRDYELVQKVFHEVGNVQVIQYLNPGKESDNAWLARRACYYTAGKYKGKKNDLISTDICVPVSKLTEIVQYTEELFKKANIPCYICAHIADGNFHCIVPHSNEQEMLNVRKVEHKVLSRAIELGGTVSGEHGVGLGKVILLEKEHGKEHMNVQESIKRALDKDNLFNPGVFYTFQEEVFPIAHL